MINADNQRKPNTLRRPAFFFAFVVAVAAISFTTFTQLRYRARLAQELRSQEWQQKSIDAVKMGNPTAWVMDSKVLPMLANDSECKQIVTSLDFTSTEIDASDATAVGRLTNVTSMMFYCTTGTEHVLKAATDLPITDLYFEVPDLEAESYLMLKDFSNLKKVHFEHVMDSAWIERLKSELPGVDINSPFAQ